MVCEYGSSTDQRGIQAPHVWGQLPALEVQVRSPARATRSFFRICQADSLRRLFSAVTLDLRKFPIAVAASRFQERLYLSWTSTDQIKIGKQFSRNLQRRGLQILAQMLAGRCPRNQQDVGRAMEKPGKRKLHGRYFA
jgi:hypothetical protein